MEAVLVNSSIQRHLVETLSRYKQECLCLCKPRAVHGFQFSTACCYGNLALPTTGIDCK